MKKPTFQNSINIIDDLNNLDKKNIISCQTPCNQHHKIKNIDENFLYNFDIHNEQVFNPSKLNTTSNITNDLIQVVPRNEAMKNFQDCHTKFEEFLKRLNRKRFSSIDKTQKLIFSENLEKQIENKKPFCLLNKSSCDTTHKELLHQQIGFNLSKSKPSQKESIIKNNKLLTENDNKNSIYNCKKTTDSWILNDIGLSNEEKCTKNECFESKNSSVNKELIIQDQINNWNDQINKSDLTKSISQMKENIKSKISRETTSKEEIEDWD